MNEMQSLDGIMESWLSPTKFIDCDEASIKEFARQYSDPEKSDTENAVSLYYAVRDQIRYDPYKFQMNEGNYIASNTLSDGAGFCVPKAILLAAVARAAGIPARLGFSDVRNHLSSKKLRELMDTDLFIWHGYASLYLNGKWIKATPAFNIEMCERFGVLPLEFDGKEDAIMHPFNSSNERHMEYINERGEFDDFPHAQFVSDIEKIYPKLCAMVVTEAARDLEFETQEIVKGN